MQRNKIVEKYNLNNKQCIINSSRCFKCRNLTAGITLISLIITIIVLLILAGITLNMVLGDSGILKKANAAKEETQKNNATEIIKSKILACQMTQYTKDQKMLSIQILGEELGKDTEISYVSSQSKKQVSDIIFKSKQKSSISKDAISKCEIEDWSNISLIYTKLNNYPYEFEINSNLQLTKIDGIEIANTSGNTNENNSSYVTKEKYDELLKEIEQLKEKQNNEVLELKEKINNLEADVSKSLKVSAYANRTKTFEKIQLDPGDYKCILTSYGYGAITGKPSEYYVSVGSNPAEDRTTYVENIKGSPNWNVDVGTISKGKGYVTFSTENENYYQLLIIKVHNGHS